jgi:hypothetical protein
LVKAGGQYPGREVASFIELFPKAAFFPDYENIATRQDLLFNTGQFDKNIALRPAREFRKVRISLLALGLAMETG